MKQNSVFVGIAVFLAGALWIYGAYLSTPKKPHRLPAGATSPQGKRVEKTDAEWRGLLTRKQYAVTRERDTEWPNSNELTHEHRAGLYSCVCCHNPLFSSRTKFDSHTGWPSFYDPIVANAIYTEPDGSRTEVRCSVCDAHLGHVFTDGPEPTGLRFCMNGTALLFTQVSQ